MVAFSYKAQMIMPLQEGSKIHTLRANRKDGRPNARVGGWASALFCSTHTWSF